MKNRAITLLISIVIILAAGAVYIFLWKHTGIYIPCVFHLFTGLYCPGCGVGRMCYSLLSLDFYQAFRYNPGIMVILPILLFFLIVYLAKYIRGKSTETHKTQHIIFIVLIIGLILFGIARNIPCLDFLAPTIV